MKGTLDARLPNARELLRNDPKERAEHATITDLIRNDLSRVAEQVTVERYAYIDEITTHRGPLLQMSSEIVGTLTPEYRDRLGSMLFELLPAGSITGAPKKKTVEIIRTAEHYERGFYTGVMGIFDGERLDSAVMIRFVEQMPDGSFCYIPKGVRCPMELSSYFRINARGTGQFERTLIVADEGSYVSYMEGCTAPMRDENQLHAAVVEIVVEKDAEVKYSTVQNWYPGDAEGKGGIFNFVTKRGICKGSGSHLSWTQVETGSAITWKYPSTILKGDNSSSEFYSVAVTNNFQQADTGTKMIHIGKNTRSRIVSKGISAGHSQNSYRGLVKMLPGADNARNFSQCDSLLIGDRCGAHTFPDIQNANRTAVVEHEATTSKISEDQLFYCNQRGIGPEEAVGLIVNGYAREVLSKLPMEFAVEAQKLLSVSLEGSVG